MSATELQRIAALPMYDFPELRQSHDALWAALASRLTAAGAVDVPLSLTRSLGHIDVWRHPRLLLGQGCEYPLATSLAGSVRVVATPCYTALGCVGATYRSAIVVRADDPAATLTDLRNRRCVVNEVESNSGMNLLLAAIAPLFDGAPFFKSVVLSGSHRRSVEMVAEATADVAAIDCVTFAHLQRLYPGEVARLRVLSWTPRSPSLPFITAGATDDSTVAALRVALADLFSEPALNSVRASLLLDGIDLEPRESFSQVLALARGAAESGFPVLR